MSRYRWDPTKHTGRCYECGTLWNSKTAFRNHIQIHHHIRDVEHTPEPVDPQVLVDDLRALLGELA